MTQRPAANCFIGERERERGVERNLQVLLPVCILGED
jgi:hypothetical protein